MTSAKPATDELCECGHPTAVGYVVCLCCLHGTCPGVTARIAELEASLDAYCEDYAAKKRRIAELEENQRWHQGQERQHVRQEQEGAQRIAELEAECERQFQLGKIYGEKLMEPRIAELERVLWNIAGEAKAIAARNSIMATDGGVIVIEDMARKFAGKELERGSHDDGS